MNRCVACESCSARHLPIYLSVYLSTAGSPPQPQPQVAGVAAAGVVGVAAGVAAVGVAAGGAEVPPLGREASVESAPPTYLASIVALRRREGDDVVALPRSAPLVITPSPPSIVETAGVLVDQAASAAGGVVIVVANGTWAPPPASGGSGGGPVAVGVVVTGTPPLPEHPPLRADANGRAQVRFAV